MADDGLKLLEYVGDAVRRMMRDPEQTTSHLVAQLELKNREELLAHLKTSWLPGMTWENHGAHRLHGPKVWQVGHRIPRAYYNGNNPEDVRRCWSKANVFSQWAVENLEQYTKLPPRNELMTMRDVWPVAWGSQPGQEFRRKVRK